PTADLVARRRLGPAGLEHVGPFEVPPLGCSEVGDRVVRQITQLDSELVERPHVVPALDPLGVRIQRRGEAALRTAQLAQYEVERLLARAAQGGIAADEEPAQV